MSSEPAAIAALITAAGGLLLTVLNYLTNSGKLRQDGLAAERTALAEERKSLAEEYADFRAELRAELDELREQNKAQEKRIYEQSQRIYELEVRERGLMHEVDTFKRQLARYENGGGS